MTTDEIIKKIILNEKVNKYKASDKDLERVGGLIHKKILPNQKRLNSEYNKYKAYRYRNKKKIMASYNNEKSKYRQDKLTKEQFMTMYKMDTLARLEVTK